MNILKVENDNITVGMLKKFLNDMPDDARVFVNDDNTITFENYKDDSVSELYIEVN